MLARELIRARGTGPLVSGAERSSQSKDHLTLVCDPSPDKRLLVNVQFPILDPQTSQETFSSGRVIAVCHRRLSFTIRRQMFEDVYPTGKDLTKGEEGEDGKVPNR